MKELASRHFLPILITVSALTALGVLCLGLQQSVWFDEIYSIDLANQSWGDIVRLTAEDVHPPFYYWLLKAWMLLFGQSELALRSMSALLFGVSLGMTGLLLRKLFGAKTALMALPFIVFAPFLLRYGFEIRMYSLASFIGVAATYLLVLVTEMAERKRRWLLLAAYALLVVLGVYTLYFMALVWIAHAVWIVLQARDKAKRSMAAEVIVAYVASVVLFAPWLPNVIAGTSGGTISPVTHPLNFDNLVGIVTYMFLYQPPWGFSLIYSAIIVGTLLLVGYLAWAGYRSATAEERRGLGLLAAHFFVPIIVLIVVTQFAPIYLERYIAQFAVAGYAGLGAVAAIAIQRAGWFARDAALLLLLILLSGSSSLVQYGNYNFQRLHTPSIKQVATRLTDCKDGAIIFADGPQVAVELGYYVKDCPVYFFNETLKMTGGFAMISDSPYRVANASELPTTDEILHVYYNEPKNTLPASFSQRSIVTAEKVSVATYRAKE